MLHTERNTSMEHPYTLMIVEDEEMIRKERNKMRAAFEFDDEDDDKPESDNKTDGE